MLIVDDTHIVDANSAAATIVGADDERALVGRSVRDGLLDTFDLAVVWEDSQQASTRRDTTPLVRDGGTKRVVEYSTAAGVVPRRHPVTTRDVSKRKQAAAEHRE